MSETERKKKEKDKKKVALTSVFAAVFLTLFKSLVGIFTGSLGILSEALHSALDLVAAVITLLAVKMSGKPSDAEHHYGHGKIENFSALIETLLLLVTCFWIIYEAVNRISGGKGLELNLVQTIFGFVIVITSIVVDTWRSIKLKRVAKLYKSQALEADALHFSTDIWSSVVVLAGLICVKVYQWTDLKVFYFADSIAALIVALIVIYVSWSLCRKAVNSLLDKAPKKESEDVREIIKNFPDVIESHDIRIRQSGGQLLIEATIHVQDDLSLHDAHFISEKLERKLLEYDKYSMVNIHVEPHKH